MLTSPNINTNMKMSPASDALDIDLATATVRDTAWTSIQDTRSKTRRAYGRTACQKRDDRATIKKRGNIQRGKERNTKHDISSLDDDEFNIGVKTAFGSHSALSRSTSLSGTVELPKPLTLLVRTRSLSTSTLNGRHGKMHYRSLSDLEPPSILSAYHQSMPCFSEWDLENTNPNVISQTSYDFGEAETPPPKQPLKMQRVELDPINEHLKARPRKIRNISDMGQLSHSFSHIAQSGETWTKVADDIPSSPRVSLHFDISDFDTAGLSPAKSISISVSSSRKRGVCDFDDGIDESLSSKGEGLRRSRSRIFCSGSSLKLQASNSFTFENDEDGNIREKEKEFDTTDDDETELGSDIPDDLSMDASYNNVLNPIVQTTVPSDELPFMPPLGVQRTDSGNFDGAGIVGSERKCHTLTENGILRSMPSYHNLKFLIQNLYREKKGSAFSSFGRNKSWKVAPLGSWSPEQRVAFLQWCTKGLGFTVRSGGGSVAFLQISSTKGAELLDKLGGALKLHRETLGKSNATTSISVFPISMEFSIQKTHPTPILPAYDISGSKPPSRRFDFAPIQDKDDAVDSELLHAVNSMVLVDKPKRKKRFAEIALIRHVTLEPRRDSCDGLYDHEDLQFRPSRHSGEYHTGNIDLLQNMHGHSPMPTSRRPARLVIGRPPVYSPPPCLGSTRSSLKGRFSYGNECMETPLAKWGIADWGSHQKGRDWGVGTSCPERILLELVERFEERYTSEGYELETSFEAVSVDVTGVCTRTTLLVLDLEADTRAGVRDVVELSDAEDVDEEEDDNFAETDLAPHCDWALQSVLGSSLQAVCNDDADKIARRRMGALAKLRRVSLCAQMADSRTSLRPRKSSFASIDRECGFFGPNAIIQIPFGVPGHVQEEFKALFESSAVQRATSSLKILSIVFSFLSEFELMCKTTPVCTFWADASTEAHANLMLISVGCAGEDSANTDDVIDVGQLPSSIAISMERPWNYILDRFPWACFLSEGAFKRVYKVWNSHSQAEEAVSVMNVNQIEETGNKHIVGAELAVSALLSSLVRRNVCPNFVLTREVFTSHHEPPAKYWGCAANKRPKGSSYDPGIKLGRKPRMPTEKNQGRFQYMRMELCSAGDMEEFLKSQPEEMMPVEEARGLLFQMAFALHAAADRFSLKHYDVKLLNFFLQTFPKVESDYTFLRYGLGSHVFTLRMSTSRAMVAKLADYGTANVQAESNGQPVTIGHFTTLENTPPDFMILGDAASQSHGHDAFGLGLCMLHLFTGHAPYEEILEVVVCPSGLKKKLRKIWEDEGSSGYDVIRSVILADVEKDDDGVILEGEPDETFYDTFYRYLVLFGIPDDKFQMKQYGRVWRAVSSSVGCDMKQSRGYGRNVLAWRSCPDAIQYANDCREYSLGHGTNKYIARARNRLQSVEGGMELLYSLVHFDPDKRATATDVLNATFMVPLREGTKGPQFDDNDHVLSFMAYSTA